MRITVSQRGLIRHQNATEGDLLDLPFSQLAALLLRHPTDWKEVIESATVLEVVALTGVVPAPPLGSCCAVWGVGLNYWSRAASAGRTPDGEPTIFMRSSATAAV